MRENIGLFKAKDIVTNEWREGHLLKAGNIFYIAVERYNENVIFNQENCDNTFIFYRIDPETLCECTGLKDKNGKLIFENDIVKVYYTENRYINEIAVFEFLTEQVETVVFYNGAFQYHRKLDDVDFYRHMINLPLDKVKVIGVEIIGNIFDNPELLEVDSEN